MDRGWIEGFGAAAVATMVVCYALESRGRGWVLAFAGACAASSVYAVAIRSWPFAAVEAIWSIVALRRYANGRSRAATSRGETA